MSLYGIFYRLYFVLLVVMGCASAIVINYILYLIMGV